MISFYDFLGPLLPMLPPEVSKVFVCENRYKNGVFNEIRSAFEAVRVGKDNNFSAEISALTKKIAEKPDP